MAITTLAGVEAGMIPPVIAAKTGSGAVGASALWISGFYSSGFPPAATAPTPGLSGAALTSYTGQLPFSNPTSGNTYLAAFRQTFIVNTISGAQRTTILVDRLWHNSGLDRTLTTAQTVNSVTWPARDIDGATSGKGVYIALEVSATITGGASSPVITMSYTNSAGASGRTGTAVLNSVTNPSLGHWFPIGLEAGDVGVQSVQSVTFSASWGTGGSLSLVAYRPVAMINNVSAPSLSAVDDALTLAMPQLWDDSVLQTVASVVGNGSTDGGPLLFQYTQG